MRRGTTRIRCSIAALALAASGCRGAEGGGALHAQRAVLEREVAGLREAVAKLERGEPILPEEAVVVSVSEAVVKEFLTAQLPFEIAVENFDIRLIQGEASFKGSPSVALTGKIAPRDHPDLVGEVRASGALEGITVEPESGTLRARVAIDHIDLLQMAGLEAFVGGATVDALARSVRKQLEGRVPEIQIPVRIEQVIELPSVVDGPVRIQAASMPLEVAVAGVFAGQGVLWVAVDVAPGRLVKSRAARP